MSKYSDKKLAKRMGTYVPPYDRNDDSVRAAIRGEAKVNDKFKVKHGKDDVSLDPYSPYNW